jgi:hypothetical protein
VTSWVRDVCRSSVPLTLRARSAGRVLALGGLALAVGAGASAASGAVAPPLPTAYAPGAVSPPLPADLAVRLPDPAWLPGLAPAPARSLSSGRALLALVLSDPARRAEGLRRLARAGFVGGVVRDFTPDGTLPGAVPVRAWAARLATPAGAAYALRTASWALRAAPAARPARTKEADGLAGARLVEARSSGKTVTTLLFTSGSWLFGLSAAGAMEGAAPLAALAARLAAAQPLRAAAAGAARSLPVDARLRGALAAARVRVGRAPRPVAPIAGSVHAATLGGQRWAIADFPGAGSGLEVFQAPAVGPWSALGDPGGPGCPRLPRAVQAVFGLAPACPGGATAVVRPDDPDALPEGASAFQGIGMWVWYVAKAGGVDGIIRRAQESGIRTVYVKAADGVRPWGQWARAVPALRAAGLRVCAWQYVYPNRPVAQAALAGRQISRGADCFVIDAEAEFEGGAYEGAKYRAARRYLAALRAEVGQEYPVGMTSFAYPDRHRTFPYSAWLEPPDGAQVNLPQIYWKAFRVDAGRATDRTYRWNALYGAPIMPIGGTFLGERPADLLTFRCRVAAYGSSGASYWSWQDTRAAQWLVLGAATECPAPALRPLPYPTLSRGSRGDPVVWLQARLRVWGLPVGRDGAFGAETRAAVRAFQREQGLPVTGRADPATWRLLLQPPLAQQAERP